MNGSIAELMRLAVHYFQNGNLGGAEQLTGQVLAKQPRNCDALHLLGVITAIRGKPAEAAMLFRKALARDEKNIELHANLAKALCELGEFEEALSSYQKAIRLSGGGAAAANLVMDRGSALKQLGRHEEAMSCYDQALALRPDSADAWTNKGILLDELRRHEEAIACHDKAISINPGLAIAWYNKATVLDTLKRYDDALACYRKAISLMPGLAKAHYNESLIRLARYDFEGGWQKYEWRREHVHEWDRKHATAGKEAFPGVPEWTGQKITPSLLVWAEQGVGDQILFSSMIEELKDYAGRLAVSLDARLMPLYERSFSGIDFIVHDKSLLDKRTMESQIPMASIGKYLRTKIADFPRHKRNYLIADGEKTGDLRTRIKRNSKLVCGLSWVSKNERIGAAKTCGLQDLAQLLSLDHLSFVDLQYGDTTLERRQLKTASGIEIMHLDDIDNFNDIDSLAALIDACDFVVTTSNVTAHLAGALGKKTFLVLPYSRGKLWYWHEGRNDSLWYPSVRLFSQAVDGDWKSVIDEVMEEIKQQDTRDRVMSGSIAELMRLAVHYFQNGNLGGAEQLTGQVLAKQPRNCDALHLLGVITAIRGKPAEAAMLFRKALARDEKNIELHANLAKALCELGEFEEALSSYQKAIRLSGGGAAAANLVMDRGSALKQLGRHEEAMSCYDQALALRPDSADAWTNKGILLDELRRHEEAIACHDKAISINPGLAIAWYNKATVLDTLKRYDDALACHDRAIALVQDNPRFWSNRGVTLAHLKRYEEALTSYKKALAIKPDYAEAMNNRGVVLNEIKYHDDALASYEQALSIKRDYAEAWSNRGLALHELKRYDDALNSYDQALSIKPVYAAAWRNRGLALYALKRYEDALISYDKALGIRSGEASAWTNRGLALYELKRYDDAVSSHDKALGIKPDYAEAWSNRGLALNELGRYEEALASYDRALSLEPDYAQALINRGVLLQDLKRHQEALDNYERALAMVPDDAGAHYNTGICRLATGDFERGWQDYEWRWEYSMKGKNPFPDTRQWAGEKNIPSMLIWAEQGVGDQILYASMLEEMKQYCGDLMVSLDPRLIPLFQRSFSDIRFVAHDASLRDRPVETQIPIGSLGRFLRNSSDDFSRQKPRFLTAERERMGHLRHKIGKDGKLACGISWTSTNEKIGAAKSMGLRDLLPLLSCNRLSFVDLQYGDTAPERLNMKTSSGIEIEHLDDIDNFNDIDGLAALIDACDFVVTVSNVTAHLAGALGKKTYLLVPYSHGKLWYWHLAGKNSLWYPSISVLPQAANGDWKSAVADVMKEIDSLP